MVTALVPTNAVELSPSTRSIWLSRLLRVAEPPLTALAAGRLRATLPIKSIPGLEAERTKCTHLEAVARTLAGLAPWLELADAPQDEKADQQRMRYLACAALTEAMEPTSPDALNFTLGAQPLVDAAFLAEALVRAPKTLFYALDSVTRERLLTALRSTRAITPYFCNWLLFSALIEAALFKFSGEGDLMRIDYALSQHEQWYKGDGTYGDGPEHHNDYYNSFVIHPFLLETAELADVHDDRWRSQLAKLRLRAVRHAAVLERMIAPDGSFPPLGRSLTYRCGAFHHLAFMALRGELPEGLAPAAVRGALNAVILRTLDAAGTFDSDGWLNPGLCGHQPGLAEGYISTGSLYLCTQAFLPLGLPASAPFWSEAEAPWTSLRVWRGDNLSADVALKS